MWQWRFLRYFPFMDFFCTFFKGMSFCIKNCTNVLRKYNRTDHTCWKTWSMVFQCQHSLGVPRKQLHNGRKFYYESDVKKNSENRYQRAGIQHRWTNITHSTIARGSSKVSQNNTLSTYGFQPNQPNRSTIGL